MSRASPRPGPSSPTIGSLPNIPSRRGRMMQVPVSRDFWISAFVRSPSRATRQSRAGSVAGAPPARRWSGRLFACDRPHDVGRKLDEPGRGRPVLRAGSGRGVDRRLSRGAMIRPTRSPPSAWMSGMTRCCETIPCVAASRRPALPGKPCTMPSQTPTAAWRGRRVAERRRVPRRTARRWIVHLNLADAFEGPLTAAAEVACPDASWTRDRDAVATTKQEI
jgi:hypothetical protein